MVLFVFIGRSQNRSNIVKKVAEKRAFIYASTKDFLSEDNLSIEILKRLDLGQNLFIDVENRADEIFNNSFIENLRSHFVIYVILAGKDDKKVDYFRNWSDYFVFDLNQQSIEFISEVLSEIIQLTRLCSLHKPFPENKDQISTAELLLIDPIDAVAKIPIQSLYHMMLTVIKSKTLGNTNLSLKAGIDFLMKFNGVPYKIMPKGIPLYRVRFNKINSNNPVLFKKATELWHPPKLNTDKGRFNIEKQPVLYTGDHILTCFYETHDHDLHGAEGFVTALNCLTKDDSKVGYISSLNTSIPSGKNIFFKHFLDYFKGNCTEQEKLIMNFLGNYINSNKFTSPNFNYEITNLISDVLYSDNQMQAIMYPSTKAMYQYNNVVFGEENAKKYVEPHSVVVYSFSFPNKPYEILLKPLYKGYLNCGQIKYRLIR